MNMNLENKSDQGEPSPLILRLCLTIIALVIGFTVAANAMSKDEVSRRILDFYAKVPGERLYIQTDRTCYMLGDTIWLRTHLVDAATGKPVCRSRYVYVELYERQHDSLVERMVIKCDSDDVFASAMVLPHDAAKGVYTLTAYTQWMRNFSPKHFAYRHIGIGVMIDSSSYINPVTSETATESDIKVAQRKGQLLIQLQKAQGVDSLFCVVCGSGNLLVTDYEAGRVLRIDEHGLKPGLVNIAMVNGFDGSVIDERQYNLKVSASPIVTINGNMTVGKREPITLTISATDADGRPLRGTLSLSVTDAEQISADRHIPVIGDYLSSSAFDQNICMVSNMLHGVYPPIDYNIETSQSITGSIRNTHGGKVRKSHLNVVNWSTGCRHEFELGDSSRFALTVDNPEGSVFTIEATRKHGSYKLLELLIDSLTFPAVQLPHPQKSLVPAPPALQSNYQQLHAMAGRDWESSGVELQEFVKTGTKRTRRADIRNFAGKEPPRGYKSGDPAIERATTLKSLLLPLGIKMRMNDNTGEEIIDNLYCKVYVENVVCNDEDLENLMAMPTTDIEAVEYFPPDPANSLFRVDFTHRLQLQGVLFIYFKEGLQITKGPRTVWPNTAVVRQLGYRCPATFYSPQYTTAEAKASARPDRRATLYWNPRVTLDANGQAKVTFYSSDTSRQYDIVIEGVASDGPVISEEKIRDSWISGDGSK
jgi:hypothetical protein